MDPISSISAIGAGTNGIGALRGPIAPVAPVDPSGTSETGLSSGTSGVGGFAKTLSEAFDQINQELGAADTAMNDFATGKNTDVADVMLKAQEANLGLQMTVSVRDRLLEAYREIMQLQV